MSYDQSQCVLLALCVCALGRGLTEKVLGLGQRKGGGVSPPLRRGVGSTPPPQPPKLLNTPRGHTLSSGGPRGLRLFTRMDVGLSSGWACGRGWGVTVWRMTSRRARVFGGTCCGGGGVVR